jgi:hypothetical protein
MATQDGLLSDLACSLNCLALKISLNIVPGTWYRYAYILMCVLYEMRTTYVARNMAAFIQETRLSVPGNSMSSKYQTDYGYTSRDVPPRPKLESLLTHLYTLRAFSESTF